MNRTLNEQDAGESYVVASSKAWSRRAFDDVISKNPGRWYFVEFQDQLTPEFLSAVSPPYILAGSVG